MNNRFCSTILSLMLISTLTMAQSASTSQLSNSTTASVKDLQKADEQDKDIDNEITDARMRAQLGSKSKFSFKSSLGYSGGSIQEPLNGIRPNYRASATMEAMTYLSGDIGVNLRTGERDNWNFGTGLTIIDPLHGDIAKPAADTRTGRAGEVLPRYQVSSPFLSWSRGYRFIENQMISSLTYAQATDSDSLNLSHTFGQLTFSQTVLANFGASKWTGGASVTVGKTFYSGEVTDAATIKRINSGALKRSDISSGLFPFMQYAFNEHYSFRTVFGYFQFAKYENSNDHVQIEPYQSIGAGISITRDIYIYPNVQFTPKDIRADRTNVALSTNINLF